jgi:DNA-binding SARP family transcriptional activator/tetratricopeptide (TPR) repeat protein
LDPGVLTEGGSSTPAPTAPLRIHLLGRFEVLRDGVPVPPQAWRRRRPADLLKLIALSPDHRLPRDRVIDALWPDKDPGAGANNLHRALYDLRLVLGGRYVDIEGSYAVLAPRTWVDVDAFEAAVASGHAEGRRAAVTLYRGDLSPEDPESPWLQGRRRLLRSRFAEVAGAVAHEAAARGEAVEAVAILRRLVAADPSAEEGHRLLMELLAGAGSRAEALRQYDAAAAGLRAAGRGMPGEALRRLRDAIERREVGPAVTPPPLDGARRAGARLLGTPEPPPLRGRAGQLQSAAELLEKGSGVLVILGEPGVGKTRLAVELARLAQARGATVLAGSACSAYPAAPFTPFLDAFAAEARDNPAAPPDPFAVDASAPIRPPDVERLRLFEATAAWLAALGAGRPLLLLLDDLHAADESSLNLLHFLALRAESLKLAVVGTCRENAVRAGSAIQVALTHLDTDQLARGMRLPRLSLAPSAERLADVLAEPPAPAAAARICQVTDGNPFHLEQVALAWDETGRGEVPRDPATALRTRLARLEPAVTRLLEAASVLGCRFPLELAAHAAGLTRDEARRALDAAVAVRLAAEGGGTTRLAHALVREELVASLDPARRAGLHRAIAEALQAEADRPEGSDPGPDRLAWHWKEAFEPRRAFRHLVAAGHRAAERSGLREAIGFHEAALALVAQQGLATGEERLELLEAVGRAHLGLGELEAAVDAFRQGATTSAPDGWRPAPEQRARARRQAALALAAAGDFEASHRELDLGLSDNASGSADEAAALLQVRARLHWHAGRPDAALAAAEWCASEAERLGQHELLARAGELCALAKEAGATAGAPRASPNAPAERRHADPASDPPFDLPLLLWDHAWSGDLAVADQLRLAGLELARCRARGDAEAAAVPLFAAGSAHLLAGAFDAAERPLREALGLFRAAGSGMGEALVLHRLGELQNAVGRLYEAMETLADGIVVAERSPLRRHLLVRLLAAQARNRLAAGALHSAEVIGREAVDGAIRHGPCSACEGALRPLTVQLALARDRVDDAAAEAAILEGLANARGGRILAARARVSRGRVLAALGHKEEAVARFSEARAGYAPLGYLLGAATCARAAALLGAPREPALEALFPPESALVV